MAPRARNTNQDMESFRNHPSPFPQRHHHPNNVDFWDRPVLRPRIHCLPDARPNRPTRLSHTPVSTLGSQACMEGQLRAV